MPLHQTPWWKRWQGITAIALAVLLGLAALGDDPDGTEQVAIEDVPATAPTVSPSPTTPTPTPTPTPMPTPDPIAAVREDGAPVVAAGRVSNVVDGDTIDLADGTRVRLAIVDTPETHGGQELCGAEASTFTADAVLGEEVAIIRPAGAPQLDDFGRLLGEVVRTDGYSLNVALAGAGLGTVDERFTDEDPDLAQRARAAEASADAPSCTPVAPPPPPPEPEPEPTQDDNCHPAYTPCVPPAPPDLDCADVDGPIQVDHSHGDPHRLDGDQDGVGCEGG